MGRGRDGKREEWEEGGMGRGKEEGGSVILLVVPLKNGPPDCPQLNNWPSLDHTGLGLSMAL